MAFSLSFIVSVTVCGEIREKWSGGWFQLAMLGWIDGRRGGFASGMKMKKKKEEEEEHQKKEEEHASFRFVCLFVS